MTWLSKLVDLLFNYKELISENLYLFVTYGLICIGLTLGINKWLNNRTEKKNHGRIVILEEKVEALEMENQNLKELFNSYGIEPRLMAGTTSEQSAPTAKLIAKSLNKKKM